jgi:hypothetical protein
MDKADAKVSFGSRLAVFDSYAGRILLLVAAAQNGEQNHSADHRNKIEQLSKRFSIFSGHP